SSRIAKRGACPYLPRPRCNARAHLRWKEHGRPKSALPGREGFVTIRDAEVVIVGAGPTGLMLAAELALARVDVVIVERRTGQDLVGSRAGGLHARTIEVFDQRGIADRFLSPGQVAQVAGFASMRLDISDFSTRHPYGLGLWQNQIEHILA